MQKISFKSDMKKTRQVILWTTLAQLLLSLIAGLLLNFGNGASLWTVEFLAALALVIFFSALAWFRLYYLQKPEVKEKFQAATQLQQINGELGVVEQAISEIFQNEEAIREHSRKSQAVEQAVLDSKLNTVDVEIANIRTAQDAEVATELARMQQVYIEKGLQETPLDPVAIPGIGDVLLEKLYTSGIKTAFDVTPESIQALSGFGESKTLSLVRWREAVEHNLRANQPQTLPDDLQAVLQEKYSEKLLALQRERIVVSTAYEKSVAEIHAVEARELAAVAVTEASLRQQLSTLAGQKQELLEIVERTRGITFLNFLLAATMSPPVDWQKRVVSFFVLALLGSFGIVNLVILIVALVSSLMQ